MKKSHIDALTALFRDSNKVFVTEQERQKHGISDFYLSKEPDIVCYAESEEDVITVMNFCQENDIPLIPYGAGTSVEGQTAAIHGGVSLDLTRMNHLLEVNAVSGYVVVEPGISYNELNKQLLSYGLCFPVEAGYGATIGGMAATNASGAGALDVGSMRNNVRLCEVMVFDETGKTKKLKTGTLAAKTSADLDLKSLIIGSEGTLGVITKIVLNVRKIFQHHYTLLCQPENILQAIKLYTDLRDSVNFRRLEWMDSLQMKASLAYSKYYELILEREKPEILKTETVYIYLDGNLKYCLLCNEDIFEGDLSIDDISSHEIRHLLSSTEEFPLNIEYKRNLKKKIFSALPSEKIKPFSELIGLRESNILLIELGGKKITLDIELQQLSQKLQEFSIDFQVFHEQESAKKIWLMRKYGGTAAIDYFGAGYKKAKATDTAVPLDKLDVYIAECYEYIHELGIDAPMISHLGQGNVHFTLLTNMGDPEDVRKMEQLDEFVTQTALKYGGTCTGEHGIGVGYKLKYLDKEFGPVYQDVAARISDAITIKDILNPGKKINRNSLFSRYSESDESPTSSTKPFFSSCVMS